MKFHGITMVGPFVNQKLETLPLPFVETRDQGRLVWLNDGTLWYGGEDEWINFASGAGDANEVEDMFSDLLRTTIFMNASFDEFFLSPEEDTLVDTTDMTHVPKEKIYEYETGQSIVSTNLFDYTTEMEFIDYVLVSVDYIQDEQNSQVEVSSDAGVTWHGVRNNQVYRIPTEDAGTDLRLRFTATDDGILKAWGVLYNKDLSAACTKYGLTYAEFEAFDAQTTFEVDYTPDAVQVFLNGDLLYNTDFTATDGQTIVLTEPCEEGDIVYIVTYSTSILDPNVDFNDFVRRDGTTPFQAEQRMSGFKLTELADGEDDNDAVNMSQLVALSGSMPDLTPYTLTDGSKPFTGDQSMGGNRLTSVADGVNNDDAINKGQLDASAPDLSIYTLTNGTRMFSGDQSMGGNRLTSVGNAVDDTDAINKAQLVASAPDLTPYTLINGTRAFTGNQSMGSHKLTNLLAGTATTDAVNMEQLFSNDNIQIFPNGGFTAWGVSTIPNDGTTGSFLTVDPKTVTNIANATTGKTLAIRNVQLTQKTPSDTYDYNNQGDFIYTKAKLTDGDTDFDIIVFRPAASIETTCTVMWLISGQLI